MHRPGRVAARLNISPGTLRVWSMEFSQFLSQSAKTSLSGTGTRSQRRYTDSDLIVFQRIKTALAEGVTYEEVRELLAQPSEETIASDNEGETETQSETAAGETASASLAIIEQYRLSIASMQQTIGALERHLETLQAQAERDRADRDRALNEAQELRRALLAQAQRPEPERPPRPSFWDRLRGLFGGD